MTDIQAHAFHTIQKSLNLDVVSLTASFTENSVQRLNQSADCKMINT